MKLSQHTALSVVVGGAVYAATGSVPAAAAAFAAGIFIDLDHLLDYLILFGIPRTLSEFFKTFYHGQLTRVYIVLHAWEWVAVLGVLAVYTSGNPWIIGVLAGVTVHMAVDQYWNRPHPLGYTITWRVAAGFSFSRIFPRGGIDQHRGKKQRM